MAKASVPASVMLGSGVCGFRRAPAAGSWCCRGPRPSSCARTSVRRPAGGRIAGGPGREGPDRRGLASSAPAGPHPGCGHSWCPHRTREGPTKTRHDAATYQHGWADRADRADPVSAGPGKVSSVRTVSAPTSRVPPDYCTPARAFPPHGRNRVRPVRPVRPIRAAATPHATTKATPAGLPGPLHPTRHATAARAPKTHQEPVPAPGALPTTGSSPGRHRSRRTRPVQTGSSPGLPRPRESPRFPRKAKQGCQRYPEPAPGGLLGFREQPDSRQRRGGQFQAQD